MVRQKRKSSFCLNCERETARSGYKYCCNTCQHEFQRKEYIRRWKNGEESGLIAIGVVSKHVKQYLRDKYDNKCCLCGWARVNPISGIVPLVADHIDGDWQNNREDNLRLVCPNCDSLSPTYAALNKGRGRKNRVVSNRIKNARRIVRKAKSE